MDNVKANREQKAVMEKPFILNFLGNVNLFYEEDLNLQNEPIHSPVIVKTFMSSSCDTRMTEVRMETTDDE